MLTRRSRYMLGLVMAAAVVAALAGPVRGADHTVGVVIFYTPTSLETASGITPEEYAAGALTERLAAAASGRFAVLPRGRMRMEERRLRWSTADDLRFARLVELGHASGADRLVIGWYRLLEIENSGGGGVNITPEGNSGGLLTGHVVFVLQIFDVSQGRIVYQTTTDGRAAGGSRPYLLERTLNDGVDRGVPALIRVLSGSAASL